MSQNNDDEVAIGVNIDSKKLDAALAAIYKRIESRSVNIKVNASFDPKAAQNLADFQRQMGQAFKNSTTGAQQATQNLQSFFSAISRGTNSLAKNSANFDQIGAKFDVFAKQLSNIKLNTKNAADVGKFFRDIATGTNSLMRATKNIDNMVAAINKLVGRLQILAKTGQLDLLKNLPANMGFTEKGGIRMQPIKVMAPNEEEWNKIKGQLEQRIANKPIKAKIEPEMAKGGLQRFQNLLIALSFGQFSQGLERMSRQIISSYSSIEQAQTTLRTVYRDDPKRAEKVYGFLSKKEAETPFTFEEMLQGGTQFAVQEKQMKKYGFNVERAVNMASELAAAFGQGKPGAIMDIQTGISRLMTGDQNGFEILDKYGISRSSLRQSGLAVGKQGVKLSSDDDIKAVLEAIERFQMKNTGGNLAERQNQTVAGQISNMQSQAMRTQASLMAPLEGVFRDLIGAGTGFLRVIEMAPAPVRGFVGAMVMGTAALLKTAQQVSSVGLLLLGAHNAGLFNRFMGSGGGNALMGAVGGAFGNWKGGRNASASGSPSNVEAMAMVLGGQWAGNAGMGVVNKTAMQRMFPTLLGAGAGAAGAGGGILAAIKTFMGTLMTGIVDFLSIDVGAAITAALATETAVLAGGALAIAGSIVGLVLGAVATGVGIVAAVLNPKKVLTMASNAVTGTYDFIKNGISGLIYGDQSKKVNTDSYNERWHTGSKDKHDLKRQQDYAQATAISKMSSSELRNRHITRNNITSGLATTMLRRQEYEKTGQSTESEEYKQMNDQMESLLLKRAEYNKLIREANEISETELQIAIATNQAKVKLGLMDSTQYAKSLDALTKKRKLELDAAIEGGDANDIAVKTQAWFEALVQVRDAQKQITDDMRGQVKAANDLIAATGGTEEQSIAAAAQDANLMPHDTPAEVNARNSALAGVEGKRFNLGLARKRRGFDAQEATGDTLGAQIGRLRLEGEDAYRSSGSKADRAEIDRITNAKILQARFEFYQSLYKLAQENLTSYQSIENQRLQIAKTANDSELDLKQQSASRLSIEGQLGANSEIKKLVLRQQDLILTETRLKQKQAKAKFESDLQNLEAALANAKAKGGTPQAQLRSMERGIELRKEAYRGEKADIASQGANSLNKSRQGERFRNEDLEREAAVSKLESQAEALNIAKDKLDMEAGKSKEKYLDLLKQELGLELQILKAKLTAALKNPKLTSAERENLKAQYENDVASVTNKYSGQASDSKVAGYQAKIQTYKSALDSDPKMKPQDKLMNLKKQLDLEKAILYEKYKKEASAPGADKLTLQKTYMKDLNDLQLRYLDDAKKVTNEFEAQNQALIDRYNNKEQKGMFSGFSMGEVFGVDQLAENMATDSEYSQMMYNKMGANGGSKFDPFSKDKWDVKDYANQAKQDAFRDDKLGPIPSNMKELDKVNLNAEYTLKVVMPDGSTTTFKDAYNNRVNNNGKGTM